MKILFCNLLWFTVFLQLSFAQNDEPCNIDGVRGTCVPLHACAQYVELLKTRASTLKGLSITKARQCGFEGLSQKVCCPEPQAEGRKGTLFVGESSSEEDEDFVDDFPKPVTECGIFRLGSSRRVAGGIPVKDREMSKFMALLGYDEAAVFWQCGGSVITARHVLTAAHCIRRDLYIVRVGELDLAQEEQDYGPIDFRVKRGIRHEGYTKYHNDIGVVVLDGEIDFKKTVHVKPICLPIPNPKYKLRKIFMDSQYVIGWGEVSDAQRSTQLNYAYLVTLDKEECVREFSRKNVTIDDRVLCAGDVGGQMHDACDGDSGGPLVTNYFVETAKDGSFSDPRTFWEHHYQTGIVSYGYPCKARHYKGVYTNVEYFIPWLEKTVLGKGWDENEFE